LIETFLGQVPSLSKQKFSSNVIEKCLRTADSPMKRCLIEEMLPSNELERMLRDSYANYVIQTAMDFADADTKARLVDNIRPILPAIRSTPYGRRIQGKIQALDSRSGASSGQITPNNGTSPGQIPLGGRHSLSSSSTPHRRQSANLTHPSSFGGSTAGGIRGSPNDGTFSHSSGYNTPSAPNASIESMLRGSTAALSNLNVAGSGATGHASDPSSTGQTVGYAASTADGGARPSLPSMNHEPGRTVFVQQQQQEDQHQQPQMPSAGAAGYGRNAQQHPGSAPGGGTPYFF
jgi:hypothetical protein